jgi:large subunit ribosomal protein L14e
VGRVAKVNYGGQEGSLAVIVDIVNDNRVLVDGENIPRQVIPIKRLSLTKFKVPVGRGARTGVVRKIIAKEGIAKKWATSHLGKTAANRTIRAKLNDFERFKVMVLRKRVR